MNGSTGGILKCALFILGKRLAEFFFLAVATLFQGVYFHGEVVLNALLLLWIISRLFQARLGRKACLDDLGFVGAVNVSQGGLLLWGVVF